MISTYKFLNKWEGTPSKFKKQLAKFNDINDYILSDMWEESDGPDFIFKTQTFWLTDRNDRSKVIVDYVGKLETLDEDLNKIMSTIEGKDLELSKTLQLNKTEGDYELSEASIAKINQVYSRDFSFWGYEMISSGNTIEK